MNAIQPLLVERRMKFMPYTVQPSDSVAHARALLDECRSNHLPVVSKGRLVGIVSSRDLQPGPRSAKLPAIAKALEMHPDRVTVESVMTTAVQTAKPSDEVNYVAELMRRKHLGILPVVEQGRLVGVISRIDIIDAFVAHDAPTTRYNSKPIRGTRPKQTIRLAQRETLANRSLR